MSAFPWAAAMQFGLGELRLAPDAFWRMTPRELAAAMAARQPPMIAALGRARLDELTKQFPDEDRYE